MKKKDALHRAQKAHILRNITFALAVITGIYFASALDNSGSAYVVAVIGLAFSFMLLAATMIFERYAICTIIKNGLDISYQPIFYWFDLYQSQYEKSSITKNISNTNHKKIAA